VDSTYYYSGQQCPVCANHGGVVTMDGKGGNNGYGAGNNSECNLQSRMNLNQGMSSRNLTSKHSFKSYHKSVTQRSQAGKSRHSHQTQSESRRSSNSSLNSMRTNMRNHSLLHIGRKIPEWRKDDSKINEWCKCGCCETQKKISDNICCTEFPESKKKFLELETFKEGQQVDCITKHPAFFSLVLDEWVLQKAWMTHKQQYDRLQKDVKQKERYTEMATHQFVMWYYGYHNDQVRLPSCVTRSIDKNFTNERIRRKSFPKLN